MRSLVPCSLLLLALLLGSSLTLPFFIADLDPLIGLAALGLSVSNATFSSVLLQRTTLPSRRRQLDASAWLAIAAALGWILIPFAHLRHPPARRAQTENSMRQLVTAMVVWSADHQSVGAVPDLDTLLRDLHLPPALVRVRGSAIPLPHFLYVRPANDVGPGTPVLLEDPACEHGEWLLLAYADGHVGRSRDRTTITAVWTEARRLAASAEAATSGVPSSAWTVGVER